ncbi:TonB-dependent receptor [Methylomonas sp. UP202]|uniref:TonB-dependent receptor domain-containing protein n=1 Tax=Methylomonas sp. UP202 TaxID=3040943 RepID=UPI00247A282A|nr:TonB-dependent receptor [Methylomonas sp. UP202]WGS86288.1 TonB-dependent receptor [Methylomonas sp. UP202]
MHKPYYPLLALAGAGTVFSGATPAESSVNLPDTVVTATRTATLTDELASATTVFTRADIEQSQVKTLPDLLKTAPGLDITQNGGYGQQANVYMRGTNSDHILVLIDGIKAGSVTLGTTAFQWLPIDQIERVEITRGPQSALYGSEAIGGVIQIFTRKGARTETPSISLDAGAGSFDTVNGAGSISGKWGDNWYSLGASHLGSQGFNTRSIGTETDRDAYYNTGLNARVGHRFANNAEVEAFFMRAEGKSEYDGTPNRTDFVNQVVGTTASFDVLEHWRSIFRFGQTEDRADNFNANGQFNSQYNTTRWNASWQNEFRLTEAHRLTLGSDYRLDEVRSSVNYSESSRYDVGVFADLHSRLFDRHFINAALRWDENQAFGDRVTGNFGWRFNWDYGLSAFASFGNAFKAPTFNDLYWPHNQSDFAGFTYITEGNPRLKPEESTTFEAGLAGQHDWLNWQLRAYHTNIDNLIDWAGEILNSTTYRYQPQNVDKAQIDGLEAELGGQWLGWQNKLSMSLLSPRNRQTNLDLARRAEQSLSYDLSRSFGAVDVGGHVLAQGHRYDDRANTRKVDGFVTVDLRTAFHIDKHWTLSAKLNNLLDKQYQTVDTYNTAGRNFYFSVHYNN